jgi:hypothetical protein
MLFIGAVLAALSPKPANVHDKFDALIEHFDPGNIEVEAERIYRTYRARNLAHVKPSGAPDTSVHASSHDVDLFLVGLDATEALSKVEQIHECVRRAASARVLCITTRSAISFCIGYPKRFVCRHFEYHLRHWFPSTTSDICIPGRH